MRIFVVFEKKRFALDFSPDATVKTVRDDIIKKTSANTTDNKKEDKILELIYGGGALKDDLILKDIGIGSGSTVRGALKVVQKPKLVVLIGYENNRPYNVMDNLEPVKSTIYDIRAMICRDLGLPVSTFRLIKASINGTITELYDCNTMYYYGIEIGSTVLLEIWDGWCELIKSSIQGHYKVLPLYLSYDEFDRQFQYKVALYIAAHFGHIGLASAMLKAGARPDLPIGPHPTRKWCNVCDHDWVQKCPVHVAAERGHLVILKMFIKNNITCMIAKDNSNQTPWNIVVRKRHKDCFGYLLARQWGRKNAKDMSIPILTYCHVLRWCERAKANALLKYGTSKSTLKGLPTKEGALVGTVDVILDGFSVKPMNSKSFNKMPRPTMHPSQLFPVLNKAKRNFRGNTIPPLARRSSSRMILNKRSTSESSSNIFALTESPSTISNPGDAENNLTTSFYGKKSVFISTGQAEGTLEHLPDCAKYSGNLRPLRHRTSRVSFAQDSFQSINDANERTESATMRSFVYKKTNRKRKKSKRTFSAISDNLSHGGAVVPLPAISEAGFTRPYFYWNSCEKHNPVEDTLERYRMNATTEPRQNAIDCLGMSSLFTKKPWLKQVDIAVCIAKRGVTKQAAAEA